MTRFSVLCIFLFLFSSCASVGPVASRNPAPNFAFNTATNFSLLDLTSSTEIREREPEVVRIVQSNINTYVRPLIEMWEKEVPGRTLILQPKIDKLRYISRGERVVGGVMAGASYVQLSLRITDGRGQYVAEPLFFQEVGAVQSTADFAASDRAMLDRVVDLMINYLKQNYPAAVGSVNGKDE